MDYVFRKFLLITGNGLESLRYQALFWVLLEQVQKLFTQSLSICYSDFMFKKTDVIFVLFFCCPSLAQAGDLSKLVEKRISQDGTTLDLKGLNIGQKGSKKLAAMESLASVSYTHLTLPTKA